MKQKQPTTTSTQQQTSDQPWVDCPDPWNLRGRLPMTPVWKDKKPTQTSEIPREARMRAVFYKQEDGTWLTAYSPKPPTPEAVARAQFVDKTYVWKESSKAAKPS